MVYFFLSLLKRKLPQRCPKRGGGGEGHIWTMSKRKKLSFRITSTSPVTPCSTVQLANYLTLLLILYICLTIEISNSLAVHLFKFQTVLLFNNTASQLSKFPSVNSSNCQATSGLFGFTLMKNYYRVLCQPRWSAVTADTSASKRIST